MKIHFQDGVRDGRAFTACGRFVPELNATQDPRQVTCTTCRRTDYWSIAASRQSAETVRALMRPEHEWSIG